MFFSGAQSVLAYATVNGYIVGFDLRSNKEVWKLKNDPRKGKFNLWIIHYVFMNHFVKSCEFDFGSWRGVLDTTLCDKSLSVNCGRSVVFSGYSCFLHQ
jgi:hypothetical protein